MTHLPIFPILLPLAAGIICTVMSRADIRVQRAVSLSAAAAMLPIAWLLLARAGDGTIDIYALGAWRPPFGIVLVLDRLAALMVSLCTVLALPALVYAAGGVDAEGRHFHALFQFQLAGLNGAFLTGDLFNLFVFFEVLLLASYGLLTHSNGLARARAGLAYVILNLTGSAVFLIALGLLYGTLGTLNLADVAQVLPHVQATDQALVRTAAALLIAVFALKAALLPMSFWLPHVYGAARAPVAVLFAIMTKVGIYAILRVSTIGLAAAPFTADLLKPWLTPLALATIAMGTIGALAARRLTVVVANLVVVSAGTLLAAVAAGGVEPIAAALYYLVHTTLVSAGFFLLAERIAVARAEGGDTFTRGTALQAVPGLALAYLLLSLAICGMPPLSGFVGKLMVMHSLRGTAMAAAIWTALLLASLLPALMLARGGSIFFWEPGPAKQATLVLRAGWPAVAFIMLLLASPAMTVLAKPVADYARATAEQMLDANAYRDAVFSPHIDIQRDRRP